MERLSSVNSLVVSQERECGGIISGFNAKNKYTVSDETDRTLYYAAEKDRLFLVRQLVVMADDNRQILRIERPYRFFFDRAEIFDAQDQPLGLIKRNFSILMTIYTVYDHSGKEIFHLFGPLICPCTFSIQSECIEVGKITRRSGNPAKEVFTNADNIVVIFSKDLDVKSKALLLGAGYLIDFVHYHNTD